MRDNHNGMPEILDAFQEGEHYFGLVQLERPGEQRRFRFDVSRDGYLALKRVLQLRPFDKTPGVQRRYFFAPAVRRLKGERVMMTVRVEQGRDGKQVETEAARDVVSNLMWFYEFDDWSKADHLAVAAQRGAAPNDEERVQPKIPMRASLARSSSSVSFPLSHCPFSTTPNKPRHP